MLKSFLVSSVSVYVSSLILPGVDMRTFWSALGMALLLGILNVLVKPILLVLTIPITIFTLGLFIFILDALIIYMASGIMDSVYIDNFWWAIAMSIIVSISNSILWAIFDEREE